MKINSEHVGRLLEARLARVQRASQTPRRDEAKPAENDRAVFSSRLEDLRVGLAAARASSQTEDPRLDSLARQVRAGSYRVPPQQVADALLRDLRGE